MTVLPSLLQIEQNPYSGGQSTSSYSCSSRSWLPWGGSTSGSIVWHLTMEEANMQVTEKTRLIIHTPEIFLLKIFFLCVWVFCLHVCLCIVFVQSPQRSGDAVRGPETGVKECYKSSHGHWELNVGLLKEQPGLWTTELVLGTSKLATSGNQSFLSTSSRPLTNKAALVKYKPWNPWLACVSGKVERWSPFML